MPKVSGARIFIEALEREGVKHVFGYPGGVVLKIYDELHKETQLKHYLVRHEQAAIHMADGYARATGETGCALVTSGPGATNTVTGLVNALMDSIPLVCITGQVATNMIGNDAFQEADVVGITRPATKHNYLIKDIRDIPRIIKEAFFIAKHGRPGPVLVDLPKNVVMAELEVSDVIWPDEVKLRGVRPNPRVPEANIERFVAALAEARKPVFYVGGGAVIGNASEEVTRLVDLTGVPTTMTLMGLGALDGTREESMGMLGMHGSYRTNMAVQNCDLLVSIGARFDDRVTGDLAKFAPKAKIVHLDIDPASINKNVHTDIELIGDAKETLARILEHIEADAAYGPKVRERIQPWLKQLAQWNKKHPLSYPPANGSGIMPQAVIREIWDATRGDAIITSDVGQHQMWTAQFYPFTKARRWINSGGLGTMGFGLPAAIGASIACPDETVICVSGDGSILMNIQELATMAQYNVPVVTIVLNNFFLGMVRQWQELFYEGRYSESGMNPMPDFPKLADAFGAVGFTVRSIEELRPAIDKAIKMRRPVFIDVHVVREANVYPMVAAGAALDNMIGLDDHKPGHGVQTSEPDDMVLA